MVLSPHFSHHLHAQCMQRPWQRSFVLRTTGQIDLRLGNILQTSPERNALRGKIWASSWGSQNGSQRLTLLGKWFQLPKEQVSGPSQALTSLFRLGVLHENQATGHQRIRPYPVTSRQQQLGCSFCSYLCCYRKYKSPQGAHGHHTSLSAEHINSGGNVATPRLSNGKQ